MIKISRNDFKKLQYEITELKGSAFWLETYAMGLHERARRLLQDLKTIEDFGAASPAPSDRSRRNRDNRPGSGDLPAPPHVPSETACEDNACDDHCLCYGGTYNCKCPNAKSAAAIV